MPTRHWRVVARQAHCVGAVRCIQLDELFTTAQQAAHDLWLCVALDAKTKFIPALALGPRTRDLAHHLIHQVRQTLAPAHLPVLPMSHSPAASGWAARRSSDGLNLYFYALTAHFGQWLQAKAQTKRIWCALPGLLYAQVQKIHRRRHLVHHLNPAGSGHGAPDSRQLENAVWFTRAWRATHWPGASGTHCTARAQRGQVWPGFRRPLTSARFVRPDPNRLHRAPQSHPPSQSRPTRPPFVEYGPTARRTLPPSRVVACPLRVISSNRIWPCVKNSISLVRAAVDACLNFSRPARPRPLHRAAQCRRGCWFHLSPLVGRPGGGAQPQNPPCNTLLELSLSRKVAPPCGRCQSLL